MATKGKLLLVGGSNGNAHLQNYFRLIEDRFDEVLVVSNREVDYTRSIQLKFGLRNPFECYQSIRKMKKIIRDFQPDIIHVHQANAYGLITALANEQRIPLILTTWGSDVLTLPNRSWIDRKMVKYCLNKANRITADAQFMAEAIHSLIGDKPVLIANFGVDFDGNEVVVEREKVIYSNRMHEPLYQIDQLIKQCSDFLHQHPDWKLRIAASGSGTERLKSLAAEVLPADSYAFIGFQNKQENQRNYLAAKMYVSIPTTDGTSISLLEAMAYGCIPIVSDLPANREWIEQGKNGIISAGDLSKDLNQALTFDVQQLRDCNHQIIQERATKKANRDKFIQLYDQL